MRTNSGSRRPGATASADTSSAALQGQAGRGCTAAGPTHDFTHAGNASAILAEVRHALHAIEAGRTRDGARTLRGLLWRAGMLPADGAA